MTLLTISWFSILKNSNILSDMIRLPRMELHYFSMMWGTLI